MYQSLGEVAPGVGDTDSESWSLLPTRGVSSPKRVSFFLPVMLSNPTVRKAAVTRPEIASRRPSKSRGQRSLDGLVGLRRGQWTSRQYLQHKSLELLVA